MDILMVIKLIVFFVLVGLGFGVICELIWRSVKVESTQVEAQEVQAEKGHQQGSCQEISRRSYETYRLGMMRVVNAGELTLRRPPRRPNRSPSRRQLTAHCCESMGKTDNLSARRSRSRTWPTWII